MEHPAGSDPVRLAETAPTVLMQPMTLCNLDCRYCYLPERALAKRMRLEVADAVHDTVRQWSRRHPVAVVWHGGEPLATGLSHFRALLERFGPGEDHPIVHAVQTNATLIDQAWCELFASRPVYVSVSIDGPGPANAARVDHAGRASTDKALRGIERLRQHGLRFSLISVVTDPSPQAAADLYGFACELGCDLLGVNLAERKGVNEASGHETGPSVIAFWQELAARWQADPRIRVRELEDAYSYVRAELTGTAARRAALPIPLLPMVTFDGEVVPVSPDLAGFSSPRHGPFTVGNVLHTPLAGLMAEAGGVPWVAETLDGIANCRAVCEYFAYCRGGQASNKYFETGCLDATETAYCRTSRINLMEGILRHAEHAHS
ncbi:cyclophane-forming radical SAM peptide maturase AmcB [Streptomyces hiroshimensis]|uniref:Radical SAM protein n=1 Tax=Streptomyces hiroshimensis TaxID=66424 RepID=A0ABQ2Z006_9ACTN|nr:cyclophane-forming radical SAM peptide maturase AmcB [Streptomyces hiroshimensis]GGY00873.1 radical SAM protein [Streptomyces hiroshimensis]